jgi:4-hydroxy-tetrahydrodipicolinate reductase
MRIALIGYGKMGKAIEQVAIRRGHTIAFIADVNNRSIDDLQKEMVDIALEFTSPESAFENVKKLMQKNIPTVCGTTGWLDNLPEIEKTSNKTGTPFIHSSNYSIGVNIFFQLNRFLADIMNNVEDYNVVMKEIHHTEKKDAPSGTAIKLANDIIQRIDRKKEWKLFKDHSTSQTDIIIEDLRRGDVPGTHHVKYESDVDDIEIIHKAHTRQGFVKGAIIAAEWIVGQKGFQTMDDFIKILLHQK